MKLVSFLVCHCLIFVTSTAMAFSNPEEGGREGTAIHAPQKDETRGAPIQNRPELKERMQMSPSEQKMKSDLSASWVAVTALMIGADVLSLYIPSATAEFHELAAGNEQWLMLAGAVTYMMPISMILLSRHLSVGVNRIANVGAAALISIAVIAGGSLEPHYIAIATAEVALMSFIAYRAIMWKKPQE